MHVEQLQMTDFRGFKGEHTVTFHPELTVLVGLNGAGKSSVVAALATNLSGMAAYIAGSSLAMMGLHGGDVHVGVDFAICSTTVLVCSGGKETMAHAAGDCLDIGERLEAAASEDAFPELRALRVAVSDSDSVLPHIGYFHSSSTRPPSQGGSHVRDLLVGRLEAWTGAFDSESLQFDALEAWFEREENLENQRKIELNQLGFQLPSLRSLRKALRVFLTELHAAHFGGLRVVRAHASGQLDPAIGQLVIRKDDHELFLHQLSDGERRLVLMVADTARRLVILNPTMKDPLQSPGILLVDEIELHLHPQWQRRVVPALIAAFPKLQLIVSTHAPAVLATVPNSSVVVLDAGQVLKGTPQVFGHDSNTILAEVMDTPVLPDPIQAQVRQIYELIDDNPPEAKIAIDTLAVDIGEGHPELVRARGLLEFLA